MFSCLSRKLVANLIYRFRSRNDRVNALIENGVHSAPASYVKHVLVSGITHNFLSVFQNFGNFGFVKLDVSCRRGIGTFREFLNDVGTI